MLLQHDTQKRVIKSHKGKKERKKKEIQYICFPFNENERLERKLRNKKHDFISFSIHHSLTNTYTHTNRNVNKGNYQIKTTRFLSIFFTIFNKTKRKNNKENALSICCSR